MPLRQVVGLCLGAVVVIALVGIQFWFREPSALERANLDPNPTGAVTPPPPPKPDSKRKPPKN